MHSIVEIGQAECEQLLAETPIGRLGFNFAGRPMVLPVTYRFVAGQILFRTALGRKLHAVAANHPVAFEVDGWNESSQTGWSVLVVGNAGEIEEWEAFEDAELLGLHPWAGEHAKDRWVRIIPERITGRRIVVGGM